MYYPTVGVNVSPVVDANVLHNINNNINVPLVSGDDEDENENEYKDNNDNTYAKSPPDHYAASNLKRREKEEH